MNIATDNTVFEKRTRDAFVWNRALKTPLWAIYSMLPFILFKDLNATPLQIAIVVALKPVVSIFSLYWSASISQRPDRLVSNLIWAGILGVIPFLFFPFTRNPWFFIGAFGFYMMLHRGVIPAWMEIIKRNLVAGSRERVFAFGSAFGYLGDALLPFVFGPLMDHNPEVWRWIFPVTAIFSLLGILFVCRIPVDHEEIQEPEPFRWREHFLRPWRSAWRVLVERPDFRRFQMGFMLGGAGLMLMQAVLPSYFMGVLDLSYTELAIALTLCKGIGFASSSQLWARWMQKVDIFRLSSWVTALAFLFPLFLLASQWHLHWLYAGFVCYGVMQAGSELSWNLSGPRFANNEDSTVYSSVNVVLVGLRGCVAPAAGVLLAGSFGPSFVLFLGGLFCLAATVRMSIDSVVVPVRV